MRAAARGNGKRSSARRTCPPGSPSCRRLARTRSSAVPETTPSCPRDETARASVQPETPTPIPPWMIFGCSIALLSAPAWHGITLPRHPGLQAELFPAEYVSFRRGTSMNHVLLGTLAFLLSSPPALADRTVSKTVPLASDGRVTIDTYKGSIRVTPWDRAEVAVEARIVPDDSCGSERDQKEWVAATRVVIEPDGGGVRIKSDYGGLEGSWRFFTVCTSRPFVHYRVSLPRAAALRIHDYKSDTDVKDFAGRLTLDTYKGSAALVGLAGSLDLKTYKGELRARFARLS